jgi:hypothetical protein
MRWTARKKPDPGFDAHFGTQFVEKEGCDWSSRDYSQAIKEKPGGGRKAAPDQASTLSKSKQPESV